VQKDIEPLCINFEKLSMASSINVNRFVFFKLLLPIIVTIFQVGVIVGAIFKVGFIFGVFCRRRILF
jgi:hypothetical protein